MKYSPPDAEMREFGAYGFANVVRLEFELASAQHRGQRASGDVHRAVSPMSIGAENKKAAEAAFV
jgi:hypothetical protein